LLMGFARYRWQIFNPVNSDGSKEIITTTRVS
jgi:hypothetical protein